MDIICIHCGLVNSYYTLQTGPHITAYCDGCDRYIKHIGQEKPVIIYFGKYAGRNLSELTEKEDVAYLNWLLKGTIKDKLKNAIKKHLDSLRNQI